MVAPTPCRSCGQLVYWLRHATTGNRAPIEAERVGNGNVSCDLEAGTYTLVEPGRGTQVNHVARCLRREQWERP
jgi:hypothetical protein